MSDTTSDLFDLMESLRNRIIERRAEIRKLERALSALEAVGQVEGAIKTEWDDLDPKEIAAVEALEKERWPAGVTCPFCYSTEPYRMQANEGTRNVRFLWRCRQCDRQFTVRFGTIFEESRIPLRHWFTALRMLRAGQGRGVKREIMRATEVGYKSVLFMVRRINHGLEDVRVHGEASRHAYLTRLL